jgi:hypothetical protein
MLHDSTHSRVQRSFFLVGALAVAALAHAQNINVTAANASNDAIGTVNFANQTFTVQNQDGGSLHSIRSLVFVTNGTSDQLDLLAADTAGGEIVRYCGDFNADPTLNPRANFTGAVVWSASETPGGPTSPDGLSVDQAGNLFLVNQGSGTSTTPQLFVLQQLATSCAGTPPAPTFVLIDSNYGAKQTLEETLVAATTIPLPQGAPVAQVNPGDLLVLTNNPSTVLIYPGSQGNGPTIPEAGKTLINLPAGTQPGGMAFWPVDNSLLVTTSTGTILRYTPANLSPNGAPATFVSGLGNGEFKVKTGRQAGNAIAPGLRSASLTYAFVADNNGGRLLEFNDQGVLISTVTTGVQHPQGLAVTNVTYQTFAGCFQNPVCNLLGNNSAGQPLLIQQTAAPVPGNILGDMCVVAADPRVVQYGSCTAAASAPNSPYANGLPVAQVCGAGFDNPLNHLVLPNSMCGASNGSGFTLIRILTGAYGPNAGFPYNGAYVEGDSEFSGLPSANTDPSCAQAPFQVGAWAPLGGEGKNPVGHSLLDVVNGCDSPHQATPGTSLFAFGLNLNTGVIPGGLVGYATTQYTTLLNTVAAETNSVASPPATFALTPPGQPGGAFTSQLQQCIQTSQGAFLSSSANYSGAAQELLVADYDVFSNATFAPPFTPDFDYPNPSGLLRTLLEATRFTVGVRLVPGADTTPPAFPPVPSTTTPVNITPTITGIPGTSATVGHHYTFSPTTADFAGNTKTLTYALAITGPGPQWLALNPTKKNNQVQVTGTPAVSGNYSVRLTVSDGCASPTLSWVITVP